MNQSPLKGALATIVIIVIFRVVCRLVSAVNTRLCYYSAGFDVGSHLQMNFGCHCHISPSPPKYQAEKIEN